MLKHISKISVLLLCLTVTIFASVLYVDADISDGFWQDSYTSLQSALTAATAGDEIWVAQGVYTPGTNRGDSFTLKEGVKIYGGFYGGESSRGDRDLHVNPTILSGDIGVKGDPADNCYHVISASGTITGSSLLDGFVITGGYADDGNGGGGMLLQSGAAPTISQCAFTDNYSVDGGGAVMLQNGAAFRQCLFNSNTADLGGAVCSYENKTELGDPSFDLCTFVNNIAGTGSALYFEKRESAYIDSSVFWNNRDGSGNLNSLSLSNQVSSSVVSNAAFDDALIEALTKENILYYTSSDVDGPFINTTDYRLDNDHGIPRDFGWYNIQAPLVLNIKVFLGGAF